MRKYLVLIILLISSISYGQDDFKIVTKSEYTAFFIDPTKETSNILDSIDLSKPDVLLKYVLNNEFSRLVTGNSLTGLGNFASVSTEDETLSASFNVVQKKGVWDITVSGGSTDNITTLISETTINSGISIGVSYHIRLDNNEIAINDGEIGKIEDAEWAIRDKYKNELAKLIGFKGVIAKQKEAKNKELKGIKELVKTNKYDAKKAKEFSQALLEINSEIDLINSQLKFYGNQANIDAALEELTTKRDDSHNKNPFKNEQFKKDSIELVGKTINLAKAHTKKTKEKAALEKLIAANKTDEAKAEIYSLQDSLVVAEIEALDDKYKYTKKNENRLEGQLKIEEEKAIKENREKIKELKATDVKMSWVTIGGEGSYKKYSLFDETKTIEKQVYDKEDFIPSFTIGYSKYSSNAGGGVLKARHVRYFSIGINGKLDNNISELDLLEVRTIDSISATREVLKKQEAYMGKFENNTFSAKVFSDYYQFFGTKDNVGLHLRGTLDIGPMKPVTSIRAGLVIPFTKIDEPKSFLNLELFVGLNDLFGNAQDKSIFGRNVFGIQATVPFNFKIL